jgi:hypothetical protein
MGYHSIRRLLQQGRINEASRAFSAVAPPDMIRRAAQLYSQFCRLDAACVDRTLPTFTHYRLLYAAYHLVSLLEARQDKSVPGHLLTLAGLELELTAGYRRLAVLGRQSIVDRFMRWMMQHHPAHFYEILQSEKLTGATVNMPDILGELDLDVFRRQAGVRMPVELMYQLLCERGRETPDFFCQWIDHAAYRIRYSKLLLAAVDQSRERHTLLLETPYAEPLLFAKPPDAPSIGEVIARFEPQRVAVI